jgi:hypothetical protein
MVRRTVWPRNRRKIPAGTLFGAILIAAPLLGAPSADEHRASEVRLTAASAASPLLAEDDIDKFHRLLVECVLPFVPAVGNAAQSEEQYRSAFDQYGMRGVLQKFLHDIDPSIQHLIGDLVEQTEACKTLSREVGLTGPYGIIPTN